MMLPLAAAMLAQGEIDRAVLVEVEPGTRRYFQDANRHGCPSPGTACRRRAYVVAGDQLVETARRGGFSLVTYIPQGGRNATHGWIESAALRAIAVDDGALVQWGGHWLGPNEAEIDLTGGPHAGMLKLDGWALWGQHDPANVARGSVHSYELSGNVTPDGGRALYSEGGGSDEDCRIRLRRLGPYLLAEDNARCGAPVSFSGVYRR